MCVFLFFFPVGLLGNNTWLVFLPLAPIKTSSAGLLIVAFATVMLSFTSLLLLGHLLGFHFYLCETVSRHTFHRTLFPSHCLINHHILSFFFFFPPPGITVCKGISTYDYIKMQRQKAARNQDSEAGNPRDVKVSNKVTKVRLFLPLSLSVAPHTVICVNVTFICPLKNQKSSVDCEPALSQSSR